MNQAEQPVDSSLRAVIIRADGTRQDLGTICLTSSNRLVQLWWNVWGSRVASRRIRKANKNHG